MNTEPNTEPNTEHPPPEGWLQTSNMASIGPCLRSGERLRLVEVEFTSSRGEQKRVSGPAKAAEVLAALLHSKDREHFVVLHLDSVHRILSAEVVSVGTLSSSLVHPREVFKGAILANAAAIICGHNHPSGNVEPSAEDLATLKRLREAGKMLGIPLVDFLIVGGEGHWAASTSSTLA